LPRCLKPCGIGAAFRCILPRSVAGPQLPTWFAGPLGKLHPFSESTAPAPGLNSPDLPAGIKWIEPLRRQRGGPA